MLSFINNYHAPMDMTYFMFRYNNIPTSSVFTGERDILWSTNGEVMTTPQPSHVLVTDHHNGYHQPARVFPNHQPLPNAKESYTNIRRPENIHIGMETVFPRSPTPTSYTLVSKSLITYAYFLLLASLLIAYQNIIYYTTYTYFVPSTNIHNIGDAI